MKNEKIFILIFGVVIIAGNARAENCNKYISGLSSGSITYLSVVDQCDEKATEGYTLHRNRDVFYTNLNKNDYEASILEDGSVQIKNKNDGTTRLLSDNDINKRSYSVFNAHDFGGSRPSISQADEGSYTEYYSNGRVTSKDVWNYVYNPEKQNYDGYQHHTEYYSYDKNGNQYISSIRDTLQECPESVWQGNCQYTKNTLTSYGYDANGNRIYKNVDGTRVENYTYSADGSYNVLNANGILIGKYNADGSIFTPKRIYTVSEAVALVKNNKNTFSIRYR